MNKEIYQDELGLYFVEYDAQGNPKKVYCDESGQVELFQDSNGLYYVEYDINGLPAKVYSDENGNRLDVQQALGTTSGNVNVSQETPTEESRVEEVVNQEIPKENVNSTINVEGMQNQGQATSFSQASNTFAGLEEKRKKSKLLYWLIPLLLILLSAGGYYAYANYFAKSKVDMSVYTIKFDVTGTDGNGKATATVENIPNVTNNIADKEKVNEIDKFLAQPTVKYNKQDGLKNGDKVEVTLELDPAKVKEYNLELDGEFKGSFEVSGLKVESSSSNSSDNKSSSSNSDSKSSENKSTSNEPNKNWFVVNGKHRADDGNHPDTQLRNGFNSWAAGQGMSLERMKGGAEFKGEILGNKIMVNDKPIDLRFIRYRGETEETVKGGEILKDTYNVVGVFSDKSSVIYITAIYNGKAQVFKADLDGGKPEVKDGLIVFKEDNNSSLKSMFQGVIDRMK